MLSILARCRRYAMPQWIVAILRQHSLPLQEIILEGIDFAFLNSPRAIFKWIRADAAISALPNIGSLIVRIIAHGNSLRSRPSDVQLYNGCADLLPLNHARGVLKIESLKNSH